MTHRRKTKQRITFALALFATFLATGSSPYAERIRPNLILIFVDDAGFADFGFQGSKEIITPNLDQLAASGIRFEQAYVSASVCAPSRAGLLTGRYQQRFGFEYNLPGAADAAVPDSVRGLPLGEKTIANYLKDLGYRTGIIGKWHLGLDDRFHPLNRGFDEFFGMRKGSSPYWSGKATAIEEGYHQMNPDSLLYLTDEFGTRAVQFIERHRGEPFFLYLSLNAPHTPMQAKPDYLESDRLRFETEVRAANAAMTRSLDENIGKVLSKLESLGLRENTLIVFTNDNGGAMPYNGSSNSPLRGTKGTVLEGGIRVPFLMSWPGVLEKSGHFRHPVSTLDILPTFLDAAGLSEAPRAIDGTSLLPILSNPDVPFVREALFWKLNWGAAVRVGDWKLVRTPDNTVWLFDLQNDISESVDLAPRFPAVADSLEQVLLQWEQTLPPPIWVSEPVWREHSLERYNQQIVDGFVRK